jgi:hypothetical protein
MPSHQEGWPRSQNEFKGERELIWDFLQRYDESWIWRCEDRHQASESTRNFAALEECVEDAVRHGYVPQRTQRKRRDPRAGSGKRSGVGH